MNRQVTTSVCQFVPDDGSESERAVFDLFDVNEFNPVFGPLDPIPLPEVRLGLS